MPIKPENKARYPSDWADIRLRILKRARNKCECKGDCGDHHPGGSCAAPHLGKIRRHTKKPARWGTSIDGSIKGDRLAKSNRWGPYGKEIKVVLTIAHLDHAPEHNDPSNLKAFCQRCHLLYDAELHAANAAATRAEKKRLAAIAAGQKTMFAEETDD